MRLKISRAALAVVLLLSLAFVPLPSATALIQELNVAMGKVRFYVQRPGGRSNPNGAGTVTAVIAVRG